MSTHRRTVSTLSWK